MITVKETLAECEGCGKHYAVRLSDGEFLLTTDDGKCECGSETFSERGESI